MISYCILIHFYLFLFFKDNLWGFFNFIDNDRGEENQGERGDMQQRNKALMVSAPYQGEPVFYFGNFTIGQFDFQKVL